MFKNKKGGGIDTIIASLFCLFIIINLIVYFGSQISFYMLNQQLNTICQQSVTVAAKCGGMNDSIDTYIRNQLQRLTSNELVKEFDVVYYYYDISTPDNINTDISYKFSSTTSTKPNLSAINSLPKGTLIGVSITESDDSENILSTVTKFFVGKGDIKAGAFKEAMVEKWD